MTGKKQDIDEFLRGAVERLGGNVDDGTHRTFKLLVEITLRFRDELHEQNLDLTVEQTQAALDAFMQIMKTQKFPEDLVGNAHQLVLRWLEAIKENVHN